MAGPGRAHDACCLTAWAPAFIARCWTPGRNPGPEEKSSGTNRCQFLGLSHTSLCSPWEVGSPPTLSTTRGRVTVWDSQRESWGDSSPHLALKGLNTQIIKKLLSEMWCISPDRCFRTKYFISKAPSHEQNRCLQFWQSLPKPLLKLLDAINSQDRTASRRVPPLEPENTASEKEYGSAGSKRAGWVFSQTPPEKLP